MRVLAPRRGSPRRASSAGPSPPVCGAVEPLRSRMEPQSRSLSTSLPRVERASGKPLAARSSRCRPMTGPSASRRAVIASASGFITSWYGLWARAPARPSSPKDRRDARRGRRPPCRRSTSPPPRAGHGTGVGAGRSEGGLKKPSGPRKWLKRGTIGPSCAVAPPPEARGRREAPSDAPEAHGRVLPRQATAPAQPLRPSESLGPHDATASSHVAVEIDTRGARARRLVRRALSGGWPGLGGPRRGGSAATGRWTAGSRASRRLGAPPIA